MPAKSRHSKSAWRLFLSYALYTLFCVIILGISTVAGAILTSAPLTEMVKNELGIKRSEPKSVFNDTEMTLLVLGCDEDRYYGGKQILNTQARSDMMLVAKLDFENNRVGGISIPRDLLVQLPGYKTHKINAYHAIGGPDLSKQAVEYVLGISVDRVVVLNFEAFQDMIDIVGGVDVYVPKNMDYDDNRGGLHIHLKQGRHKLNGYDAMGFIRFRKTDSDFKRVERQRDLMLSFKHAVGANPLALPTVVNKASDFLGGAFNAEEISAVSYFLRRIKSDNIKMGTLPVLEGQGTGLSLDFAKLSETLETYYMKDRLTSTASTTSGGNL